MATPLKAGDAFPEDVSFTYVPPSGKQEDVVACGTGIKYDASKEFKNKKVILVSVPGAFTPTCQEQHVTGFIAKRDELKAKGVDQVIFIAYNDHWVMSAWGKANGVYDDFILFASDDGAKFSKSLGWTLGERTARYAIVVDKGKVVYAEKESAGGTEVSGAQAVLAKL
ncbi:peroxiredoxin type-2 [Magnaporthiopsis poae ATCC 64411]|uniref:Thioredoxin peroxidase n=1 Tax=Magnaporthiopsis poae (strain ATCC 64411 / 73-15) TaxID=644358 RepID=A0A0C4DR49_MAGP6|nr:peroxiredoxin type-2 [Magnaporthiopsis poae ATCC 64411]